MADDSIRVLVLGGAPEGDELTARLREQAGVDAVLVRPPRMAPGPFRQPALHLLLEKRSDLAALMEGASAVVIAAHPFSASFIRAAVEVAGEAGLPCLLLQREAWRPGPRDRWISVDSPKAAAAELMRQGLNRPLVSLGRDQIEPFLNLAGRDVFLRMPGPGPVREPLRGLVLDNAGPNSVASEVELIRKHRIDCIVTRNVGGAGGWPKLQAARTLGLPVILLRRPPAPPVAQRERVDDALAWLAEQLEANIFAGAA